MTGLDHRDTSGNIRARTYCKAVVQRVPEFVCYDRYVSSNPKSREFLFLLPEENLGLRILPLPEFGSMD